ncbi:hypothetical protein D9M68_692360 [compost metagenome]
MVHHELDNGRFGEGQGEGLAIAQFEPGRPVSDRGAVARGGIGGTAFSHQVAYGGVRLGVEHSGIQRRERRLQGQGHHFGLFASGEPEHSGSTCDLYLNIHMLYDI